jgi:hypothetical protein
MHGTTGHAVAWFGETNFCFGVHRVHARSQI